MKFEPSKELLFLTSTTADVRWVYGTAAFLFGLIANTTLSTSSAFFPSFVVFGAYLLCNFFISLISNDAIQHGRFRKYLLALSGGQVFLDFAFAVLMVHVLGSSFLSVAYVFFVIPIVLSLLYLSFWGTMLVSICASIAIVFFKLNVTGTQAFSGVPVGSNTQSLAEVAVLSAMYFVISFFGAWVIDSIRRRKDTMAEKIHKEEDHVKRLSILAHEFDRSAKLLVRRDLDLMKAHRDLERIDEMKSEIISVVAHQLRTPLSAVKWTLKMLTDGDAGSISPEQKTMLMKAYDSNERMISLVNDMLSADRMESGKFRYRFFPIQIEDLIENVITEILPKANERGVGIRFLRPVDPFPRVTIDPDKIREVLQNLIDNAVKYSKREGVVVVGLQREEKALLCLVSDQGIGIPKADQEKIFGRFFRAQNALRVETDGSGLGLFIVRGIIQRHGGDVSFESEEGKGTTMKFRLPFGPLPPHA